MAFARLARRSGGQSAIRLEKRGGACRPCPAGLRCPGLPISRMPSACGRRVEASFVASCFVRGCVLARPLVRGWVSHLPHEPAAAGTQLNKGTSRSDANSNLPSALRNTEAPAFIANAPHSLRSFVLQVGQWQLMAKQPETYAVSRRLFASHVSVSHAHPPTLR
jgi:hypothetical protein